MEKVKVKDSAVKKVKEVDTTKVVADTVKDTSNEHNKVPKKVVTKETINTLKHKKASEVLDSSKFEKSVDGKTLTLNYTENAMLKHTNKEIFTEIENLKKDFIKKVVEFAGDHAKDELAKGKVDQVKMTFPFGVDKRDTIDVVVDKLRETSSNFNGEKKHFKSAGLTVVIKSAVTKNPKSLIKEKREHITNHLKGLGKEWEDLYKVD